MEGFWPIFYLAVVLKIPVIFGIWIVLWAMKQYDAGSEFGGQGGDPARVRLPRGPRGPIPPRRGPHRGRATDRDSRHPRVRAHVNDARRRPRRPRRARPRT